MGVKLGLQLLDLIFLNNKEVTHSSDVKFLGIYITENLS
jgi:hypothetical protein